jgi:hypothetical protein
MSNVTGVMNAPIAVMPWRRTVARYASAISSDSTASTCWMPSSGLRPEIT